MSCRVTDGNSTHHLSMIQCVDLTGMARDPWAHQSIWGERHWLHLSVGRNVKGIGTDDTKKEEMHIGTGGGKRIEKKIDGLRDGKLKKKKKKQILLFSRRNFVLHWSIHKHTYGLPPGIPVRLGGIPGTRMWGWGSNPTLRREQRHFKSTVQTHSYGNWPNAHRWKKIQTLMSSKQTDTLKHTHTPTRSEWQV